MLYHRPLVHRRSFLRGCAAAVATGFVPRGAFASPTPLTAGTRVLEVNGRAATVFSLTTSSGRPGLEMQASEEFAVSLTNATGEDTLIHWHGLTPPIAMDGTPMLSGPLLPHGQSSDYIFPSREIGTHWMHSHVGLQEQRLLAAPLIIREAAAIDEQDHVVMLHDFTFRDPQEILAELQGGGGAHAGHDMSKMAQGAEHDMSAMPTALATMTNDIVYDALLANDRTLDDPEIVSVEKSGRIRLRIINGAAASNMWIDLGELRGELIAVDGKAVRSVSGQRFPLAVAQRADIRIQIPSGSGVWPVLFQAEGSTMQTGIVLQSGGAAITKISGTGTLQPAIDLSLERQLISLIGTPDIAVSRTEMVMLTGGGADYAWGLNGKASMHDVIFNVREGERYEIMMHNMTGMAHPMHLHGHYFKVVAIGNQRIDGAIRDTVLVPVGETVTIQFDANNPGTWAFHCHHLYHMNSGMMGAIAYQNAA